MTRSDLSDAARALVALTRDAYEPSASNRAQVQWRVERTLSSRAVVPTWRRRRPVAFALAAAGGLVATAAAAAGAVMFWAAAPTSDPAPALAVGSEPPAAKPRARVESAAAPAPAPVPTGNNEARAASTQRRVPPARRAAQPAPRSSDLAAETLILARAQAATNRGEAGRALELLSEYDRTFGKGSLSEERSAARVLALCAAGRHDAAKAAARGFLAQWPHSPQAARIRASSCRPDPLPPTTR